MTRMLYAVENMKTHNKKYLIRITVGFTGYGLGVLAWAILYPNHLPHRYWLGLLPVPPLIYVAAAMIRHISEKDEMWRKIITEAWAFSAIATGFTCASYVLLRGMGAPEFHAEWAFYILVAYAGIGLFFSRRRYARCECK